MTRRFLQQLTRIRLREAKLLLDRANYSGAYYRIILERTNANFATNWAIVKDWNESSRYKTYNQIQAAELYTSITSRSGGILQWIRQYW